MIKGIDHIELIVRDLDEYVSFLKTLGFETVRETPHHGGSVEMKPPGEGQPVFEIHQVIGEEVIGVNHIAFKVDDVNAAHAALKDYPGMVSSAPGHVKDTGRTNLNLRDPDGWRLQLVQNAKA
ncbi:MAG: VOC family protein [Rhodospirillaceae bacterium]|jgi:catechol 2,3-dioxygenase-like lactoylglutathione lyase family enzyme|nr:VOC family protein [Rhodospirillaceae bacterium]MBT3781720.1 VOC family protein [Rhodospirillaceae bacterium]MBT3975244.1 VOC family protein [Rhodospirillaceae bacterium]MBT4169284.1 VOC family protein [Rhodospirillaceae bacterium]MBT4562060.1 VOC family protein [Rhodospirillaceae bacterium]